MSGKGGRGRGRGKRGNRKGGRGNSTANVPSLLVAVYLAHCTNVNMGRCLSTNHAASTERGHIRNVEMFSTILLINKDTKTLVAFGTAKRDASVDTNGPFGSDFQAHVEVWSWVPLYIDIENSWDKFRGGTIGDVETWRQIRTYIQNAMRVDDVEVPQHEPVYDLDALTPLNLEHYRAVAALERFWAECAAN